MFFSRSFFIYHTRLQNTPSYAIILFVLSESKMTKHLAYRTRGNLKKEKLCWLEEKICPHKNKITGDLLSLIQKCVFFYYVQLASV